MTNTNETLQAARPTGPSTDRGGKYLMFRLAREDYGVQIVKVREIIGIMDITAIPQMPSYMKGVINLRGKVIPVIDLRLKFGLPPAEYTDQTCIIVVDAGSEVGVIVDTVSEVLDITDHDIEPPPAVGATADMSFIQGVGKVDEAVKILLNLDRVLSEDELTEILAGAEQNGHEA
jgi:purine-binding chemotaxis protein CheW